MRHAKSSRKFDRNKSQRKALIRSLVRSLITHERIETTVAKAKEARRVAEHLITLGRRGTLADRRKAFAELQSRDLVHTLFTDIAPLFKSRNGGYTRIIRTGSRSGDGASLAILEFVEKKAVVARPKKEKPEKKPKAEVKPEVIKKEEPSKKLEKIQEEIQKPEAKKEEIKPEKKKEIKPEEPKKKGIFDGLKNLFRKKDKEEGK